MAALIEISDIENALGRAAEDEAEEANWQYFIDTFSFYLNNYVKDYVSFTIVEDETRRFKASYSGCIYLPGPVIDVTSVKDFRTQNEDLWVDWDGMNELFYLESQQVVDVTWSYGYDEVPGDIKNLVLTAVLNELGELSPTDLRSFKVGDVEEQYRDSVISQTFGSMAGATLRKYVPTTFTIDTGGSGRYPDYNGRGYVNDFD